MTANEWQTVLAGFAAVAVAAATLSEKLRGSAKDHLERESSRERLSQEGQEKITAQLQSQLVALYTENQLFARPLDPDVLRVAQTTATNESSARMNSSSEPSRPKTPWPWPTLNSRKRSPNSAVPRRPEIQKAPNVAFLENT